MPTYTINGKKIRTDRILTEAEVDEIAASMGGTPSPTASQEAPKKATEEPGFMSQVLSDFIGSGAMLPTAQMATGFSELALGRRAPELDMTPEQVAEARAKLSEQLNIKDQLSGKRLAATAVTGALDPLNLAFPLGGAARTMAQGAAGAVGGQLGAEAGQAAGGNAGGVLGGLLGGISGSGVANAFTSTIPKAVGALKDIFTGGKQAIQDVSQAAGSSKAAAAAATALATNPNLSSELLRAKQIESLTGAKLPVLPASGGDTTLQTLAMSQAGSAVNSSFTAAMSQQYKGAAAILQQAREEATLGRKTIEQAFSDRVGAQLTADKKAAEALAAAGKKREMGLGSINDRIAELSSSFSTEAGKTDIGTRLTNLVDAREAAIRSELSPQYTKLLTESQKAGIKLPAQQAQDLYEFAKDFRNTDIFSKFPALYRDINSVFAPATKPVSGKFAEKYPQMVKQAEGATFKDVPLDQLDSLKRNVNSAIRKTNDGDQLRVLGELKQQVDGAIGKIDPTFSAPYQALDKEYAIRLGIPFNEAGVAQIDKARFIENTVPTITNNASALKQVIAVTGNTPETFDIVKDAFLYKIGNDKSIVNTTTGEVNTNQLKRFLAKNKETIDLIPGLRSDLEKNASKVDILVDNRDRLLEAQKTAKLAKAESLYTQAYGTSGGINTVVKQAMANPEKLDALLKTVSKDVVAKEGIKIAMLDNVIGMAGDKVAFFKENQQAFETVFGKGYIPKLEAMVEATQKLQDFPFNPKVNVKSITKTAFEQQTGSGPAQTASLLRNHIQSTFFKVSTLLSRFTQNQMSKREAIDIQAFLLDPQALEKATTAIKELQTKGMTDKVMQLGKDLAKNSAFSAAFGGLHGIEAGTRVQNKEEPIVDKSLLPNWD